MLNIFGFIPFCWFKPFKLNENIIFWVRKGTGVCLYSKERERERKYGTLEREREEIWHLLIFVIYTNLNKRDCSFYFLGGYF